MGVRQTCQQWSEIPLQVVDATVQFIDHPVEAGQVYGFDNSHVIQRNMQVVMSQRFEFAATKASTADGGDAMLIRPFDGTEDVWTVTRSTDGDEQITS